LNQEKDCRLSGTRPFLELKLTKAIGAQMSVPPFKGYTDIFNVKIYNPGTKYFNTVTFTTLKQQ